MTGCSFTIVSVCLCVCSLLQKGQKKMKTEIRKKNQVNIIIKYFYWHQKAIIDKHTLQQKNLNSPGIFAIPRKTASCTALMPIPKILRPLPKLSFTSSLTPIPLSFADWSKILGGLVLGRLAYLVEGARDVGRALG